MAKTTTHFLQGQDLELVEAFTSELKWTGLTHKCSSKELEAYYIAFHECDPLPRVPPHRSEISAISPGDGKEGGYSQYQQ